MCIKRAASTTTIQFGRSEEIQIFDVLALPWGSGPWCLILAAHSSAKQITRVPVVRSTLPYIPEAIRGASRLTMVWGVIFGTFRRFLSCSAWRGRPWYEPGWPNIVASFLYSTWSSACFFLATLSNLSTSSDLACGLLEPFCLYQDFKWSYFKSFFARF